MTDKLNAFQRRMVESQIKKDSMIHASVKEYVKRKDYIGLLMFLKGYFGA